MSEITLKKVILKKFEVYREMSFFKKVIGIFLCFSLGFIGVHLYYIGEKKSGFMHIISFVSVFVCFFLVVMTDVVSALSLFTTFFVIITFITALIFCLYYIVALFDLFVMTWLLLRSLLKSK